MKSLTKLSMKRASKDSATSSAGGTSTVDLDAHVSFLRKEHEAYSDKSEEEAFQLHSYAPVEKYRVNLQDDLLWTSLTLIKQPLTLPLPVCEICKKEVGRPLTNPESWMFQRCMHRIHIKCLRNVEWIDRSPLIGDGSCKHCKTFEQQAV